MAARKPAKKVKARAETAKKTAKPPLISQPGGRGALLAGGQVGGKGGRPAGGFRELCKGLVEDPEVLGGVQAVLKDTKHRHYANVLKLVTAYGFGRPELTGSSDAPLTIHLVKDI